MDYLIERDNEGAPVRMRWVPPDQRPAPPKAPVGYRTIRLRDGRSCEVRRDASREEVEAAVRALGVAE